MTGEQLGTVGPFPRDVDGVEPWADQVLPLRGPLVGSWTTLWADREVRGYLVDLGNLLVQGTGRPTELEQAAVAWDRTAETQQQLLDLLNGSERSAAGWTGAAADGFRVVVERTRTWLTAAQADSRDVSAAMRTASAALTESRTQLLGVVTTFLQELARIGRDNGVRWLQLTGDLSGTVTLNREILAAIAPAYQAARTRAVAVVQDLVRRISRVRETLESHGMAGKNPYRSWLDQGLKVGLTYQTPFKLGKLNLAPAVTFTGVEKKNPDGTFDHSLTAAVWAGADDRITARKGKQAWLALKDLRPGARITAGSTTGSASPEGEFDLSHAGGDWSLKLGGFANGKAKTPIGDVGLELTGGYSPTSGELAASALWDYKLKGSQLNSAWPSNLEAGGVGGVSWNNRSGVSWLGPYPTSQWTQADAGIANFRVGAFGQYTSKHDTLGLDVLDNALVNTAVPLVQAPALAVGTAWNAFFLADSRKWVDLPTGTQLIGDPLIPLGQPIDLPLTSQLKDQEAAQEVASYQRLTDDYAAWSQAGDQLSRAWGQTTGWACRVRSRLWEATGIIGNWLPGESAPPAPPLPSVPSSSP